jgi:regulator of sirC expression with transglutaminase-like and TPR domain
MDVESELSKIDRLAEKISDHTLPGVIQFLFQEQGFGGEKDDYYNPANSYIDQVLQRRRGIPISLAIIIIEVARRCGVPLFGVGMPGHFLVGHREAEGVFVDPFEGKIIDGSAARDLFLVLHPGQEFRTEFLNETAPDVIVLRMLNNLRMIYLRDRGVSELTSVLELLVCLDDCPIDEFHRLASALDALGRTDEAARHLDKAANRYSGTDADQMRARATHLWARLN